MNEGRTPMKVAPPLSGIWEDGSLDTCLLVAIAMLLMRKANLTREGASGCQLPSSGGLLQSWTLRISKPPSPLLRKRHPSPPGLVLQTVPY